MHLSPWPRYRNAEKSKDDFENFKNFEGRCFICFALFGLIDDGKTTSRCIQPLHTSTALWNLHASFTVAQVPERREERTPRRARTTSRTSKTSRDAALFALLCLG